MQGEPHTKQNSSQPDTFHVEMRGQAGDQGVAGAGQGDTSEMRHGMSMQKDGQARGSHRPTHTLQVEGRKYQGHVGGRKLGGGGRETEGGCWLG